MTSYLLRRASTAPGVLLDLLVCDGRISSGAPKDAQVVDLDLDGRPTVPGLADHHVHLMAQAAAFRSLDCSPSSLAAKGGLAAALRAAREQRPSGWLRGFGYDVTASGPLDRALLDAVGVGPLRIQDRTGTLWMLDSSAIARTLPEDESLWPRGVERDAAGYPTGVLRRLDTWLRSLLPNTPPDLGELGRRLAERGVTSLTDATSTNGPDELGLLAASGIPQRLTAMTASPRCPPVKGVTLGPVKIVLDECDLPSLEDLAGRVRDAHDVGRNVAVHCVDGASIVLALFSGTGPGDRIEHATVVTEEQLTLLSSSQVTVVVQPGLVATRGDRYLEETDESDRRHLYRLASLLGAGVKVGLGTDAPYGSFDPWTTVAGAVKRRTPPGSVLGPSEAVDPMTALRLMTADLGTQSGADHFTTGARADLVVLDDDWGSLTHHPRVALTMIDGKPVHCVLGGLGGLV